MGKSSRGEEQQRGRATKWEEQQSGSAVAARDNIEQRVF